MNGFIQDEDLLREDAHVDDLFDVTETVEYYEDRIKSMRRSGVLAVLGPFGCGKSTVLYQVEKKMRENCTWINFDAWKYPERKDLWEGFVLDFAEQIGARNKVLREIEGRTLGRLGVTALNRIVGGVAGIPGLQDVADQIAKVFSPSPATRVFEIQEILSRMIRFQKKPVIIVVEDIDRSGDYGRYFLETLHQFLAEYDFGIPIRVIVPMSDKEFDRIADELSKCIDYIDRFRIRGQNPEGFVDAVFCQDLFGDDIAYKDLPTDDYQRPGTSNIKVSGAIVRGQLISLIQYLLDSDKEHSIRRLKSVLRNANVIFVYQLRQGWRPDFRLSLACVAAKLSEGEDGLISVAQEHVNGDSNISLLSPLGKAMVVAMMNNKSSILKGGQGPGQPKLLDCPVDIRVIPIEQSKVGPRAVPWAWENYSAPADSRDRSGFAIPAFYVT